MKAHLIFILVLLFFLFPSPANIFAAGSEPVDLSQNTQPDSDIFSNILKKDLEKVKEKIENNPELLEKKEGFDRTPLGLAVYVNSPEIVDYLISKGANPDTLADSTFNQTALYKACENGSEQIVKALLDKGAEPNVKCDTYSDTTPLFKACENGFEKIAGMLLEKGAKTDDSNGNGQTPLHNACMKGYSEIVKMLLNKGADVNLRDHKWGYTPLHFAVYYASADNSDKPAAKVDYIETVNLLIKKRAKFNEYDFSGETPLKKIDERNDTIKIKIRELLNANQAKSEKISPCAGDIFKFINENNIAKLDEIIKKFPEAFSCQNENMTPLSAAIIGNKNAMVELMLKKGADPNEPCFYDFNNYARLSAPLHFACYNKNIDAVKLLLKDKKTNLNVTDICERTPIMVAAEKGYADIVKILAENGADVNGSALHYMSKFGYADAVELLIRKGASVNATLTEATIGRQKRPGITLTNGDETPADWANANNQKKTLEILKKNGAKLSKPNQQPDIYEEAANGNIRNLKEILNTRPELLNAADPQNAMTPLHAALQGRRSNAAALYLIEKGANINALDGMKRSPLIYALMHNKSNMAKLLIAKGADVNLESIKKIKPIHVAAGSGAVSDITKKIIYMLLSKGADINAQTSDGTTPLHIAAFSGDIELIKFLLTHGSSRNLKDENGLDAAAAAEKRSHKEAAEFIKNCDLKKLDIFSDDELLIAADTGDFNTVKKILEKKTDGINARENRAGNMLLHIAAINGDIELLKLLLASIADITAANSFGRTPLEVIADVPVNPNHPEIVKLLTEKGAAIGGARTGGAGRRLNDMDLKIDLMISAIQNGQKQIVEMILAKGIDIKTKSMDKFTFLHYAAISGRNDIAKLLIEKGAEIDPKGMRDMTPLYIAASSGNAELTKLLISKKADVNAVTTEGKTPLATAGEEGLEEIVSILTQAGAK